MIMLHVARIGFIHGRGRNVLLCHLTQLSGVHAFSLMPTGYWEEFVRGNEMASMWSWSFSSIHHHHTDCMELWLSLWTRLHGMVHNELSTGTTRLLPLSTREMVCLQLEILTAVKISVVIFTGLTLCRWQHYICHKKWHPPAQLYCIITQKASI